MKIPLLYKTILLIKATSLPYLLILMLLSVSSANASGTIYRGGQSYDNRAIINSSRVDTHYELGKALIKGLKNPYKGMKLCITTDNEEQPIQKIKRKYVKPFKGADTNALAAKIVTCEGENKRLLHVMEKSDAINVLHYLNKRFKLDLK